MAKRLHSRYVPGKRDQSWCKIKPFQMLPCVVIGYTPSRHGITTLLVAAVTQGTLQYVAELASGFSDEDKGQLAGLLSRQSNLPAPVVPCPKRARWVEPSLYCQVRFLEWTSQGHLRGAHYRGLLES